MGTPSEVAAAIILESLGFKNIKYVDKSFDYTATESVIEIKIDNDLKLTQMKALAKEAAEGKKAFVLFVSKEKHYCLFQLVSTNLADIQPTYIIPEGQIGIIDFFSKKAIIKCPRCKVKIVANIRFPFSKLLIDEVETGKKS